MVPILDTHRTLYKTESVQSLTLILLSRTSHMEFFFDLHTDAIQLKDNLPDPFLSTSDECRNSLPHKSLRYGRIQTPPDNDTESFLRFHLNHVLRKNGPLDPLDALLEYPIQVCAVEIRNECEDELKQGLDLHPVGASALVDPLEMELLIY